MKFDNLPLRNKFPRSNVIALTVFFLTCTLLAGCSGGGGSGDSGRENDADQIGGGAPLAENTGIAGQQRFRGTFVGDGGAPVVGLTVSLPLASKQATTDAAGVAEILTDTLLKGDISLQAGAVPLVLFGIKTDTQTIAYNVVMGSNPAAVKSINTFPLRSDSIAVTPMCQSCHGVFGEPNCTEGDWVSIHGAFFRCNSGVGGPTASAGSCQSCHGDRGAPQCDDPQWQTIHAWYPCTGESGSQNVGSWKCTSCHEWKGYSRCNDPEWRAEHPFSSCEGGTINLSQLHCNSCHTLRTTPRCSDPTWRAEHPWWNCGTPGGAECVSCHTFKGAARCDSSFWRRVHDFYSCSGGPSCGQCHGRRIDTECSSSRWINDHDFLASGSDTGGTANLCGSCHDNDRGGPQCGDSTWEAFHCFCGR